MSERVTRHQDNTVPNGDIAGLIDAALRFDQEGQTGLALTIARRAVTVFDRSAHCWLLYGQILRSLNRLEEADAAYAHATDIDRSHVEGWIARGVIGYQLGNDKSASTFLAEALAILATQTDNRHCSFNFQALHALGKIYARAGNFDLAINHFSRAVALKPTNLACGFDLAQAWILAGYANSENLLDDPIFLTRVPVAVHMGLSARAMLHNAQLDLALPVLEALVALAPEEPWGYATLASVYMLQMQPEQAEPLLREAVHLQPNDTSIIQDHSVALSRLYRYAEAETLMTHLIEHGCRQVKVFCNRAVQRASMGLIELASDDLWRAREIIQSQNNNHSYDHPVTKNIDLVNEDEVNFYRTEASLLPYMDQTKDRDLFIAMTKLGNCLPRDLLRRCSPPHQPDKKLRVGLLSNTLRRHPVGWLTLAGIEQLNFAEFDIICFGRYEPTDAIAQRFAARASAWHAIEGMSDIAIANFIADQSIDILIDMGGYGDAGLIQVAAFRPAPLQIKWVGAQYATTGLREIDWIISDKWETPIGFEHYYSERLLRLPDGYVCYTPPDYAPLPSPLPALGAGHVTFGCFNNVTKLSKKTLGLWQRILAQIPESRLVLRCPQFSQKPILETFLRRSAELGIDPARLTIFGRASHLEFIASYREIDIALDPVPYSGGLTTCEALYMGVPVIALAGDFFAARHSVSHLSNVGLHDWVTESADAYVERAVAAANDIGRLSALRSDLRARMLASPLCDASRFGKNLGAALRNAWKSACDDAEFTAVRNPGQDNVAAA